MLPSSFLQGQKTGGVRWWAGRKELYDRPSTSLPTPPPPPPIVLEMMALLNRVYGIMDRSNPLVCLLPVEAGGR